MDEVFPGEKNFSKCKFFDQLPIAYSVTCGYNRAETGQGLAIILERSE